MELGGLRDSLGILGEAVSQAQALLEGNYGLAVSMGKRYAIILLGSCIRSACAEAFGASDPVECVHSIESSLGYDYGAIASRILRAAATLCEGGEVGEDLVDRLIRESLKLYVAWSRACFGGGSPKS